MVKLSFLPMLISSVSIPEKETEMVVALALGLMLNSPFFPVRVDVVVPLTVMLAPIRGSPVSENTLPVMVFVCPKLLMHRNKAATTMWQYFFDISNC
jgi:hypothetical protein